MPEDYLPRPVGLSSSSPKWYYLIGGAYLGWSNALPSPVPWRACNHLNRVCQFVNTLLIKWCWHLGITNLFKYLIPLSLNEKYHFYLVGQFNKTKQNKRVCTYLTHVVEVEANATSGSPKTFAFISFQIQMLAHGIGSKIIGSWCLYSCKHVSVKSNEIQSQLTGVVALSSI